MQAGFCATMFKFARVILIRFNPCLQRLTLA